ncbi:uncharacterized protein FFM5_14443 [Fusarium fujikuroi]|nr:uncharacterized protein FFM5_14443 [Fusarium fujikuroi]
MPFSILRVFP